MQRQHTADALAILLTARCYAQDLSAVPAPLDAAPDHCNGSTLLSQSSLHHSHAHARFLTARLQHPGSSRKAEPLFFRFSLWIISNSLLGDLGTHFFVES